MEINVKDIIGEVVAKDYRTAAVFKNHAIDFCCNGNRSIEEACRDLDVEASQLVDEIEVTLKQSSDKASDFHQWPLDLLADYIEKTHHRYCETKITEIKPYLEKIAQVHGDAHPELFEIQELFNQTAGQMSMHMKKEELIVFPFVKRLMKAKTSGEPYVQPRTGSIESPIEIMMDDHNEEGERFRKIRALSHDYTTPADGCNTYRVTLGLLEEFEQDLFQHIHLENNILFPKSIELEKELI